MIYLLLYRPHTQVQYSCDASHKITASYYDDHVELALSDGRSLSLPQTVSGSGIRYEKDGIVFASKGADAFMTEKDVVTYANCISGEGTPTAGMQTFTDQGKTFSFSHPEAFAVTGNGAGYSQDWSANSTTLGLVLAKLEIPKENQPKTNFGNATFVIGTSVDAGAIKNCEVGTNGETAAVAKVTINGTAFTKITGNDAGAGNFYETTKYRTVRNNQCYSVEYTIHSTNIYNYSPDQGISEFDKAGITKILDGIVNSFKFF